MSFISIREGYNSAASKLAILRQELAAAVSKMVRVFRRAIGWSVELNSDQIQALQAHRFAPYSQEKKPEATTTFNQNFQTFLFDMILPSLDEGSEQFNQLVGEFVEYLKGAAPQGIEVTSQVLGDYLAALYIDEDDPPLNDVVLHLFTRTTGLEFKKSSGGVTGFLGSIFSPQSGPSSPLLDRALQSVEQNKRSAVKAALLDHLNKNELLKILDPDSAKSLISSMVVEALKENLMSKEEQSVQLLLQMINPQQGIDSEKMAESDREEFVKIVLPIALKRIGSVLNHVDWSLIFDTGINELSNHLDRLTPAKVARMRAMELNEKAKQVLFNKSSDSDRARALLHIKRAYGYRDQFGPVKDYLESEAAKIHEKEDLDRISAIAFQHPRKSRMSRFIIEQMLPVIEALLSADVLESLLTDILQEEEVKIILNRNGLLTNINPKVIHDFLAPSLSRFLVTSAIYHLSKMLTKDNLEATLCDNNIRKMTQQLLPTAIDKVKESFFSQEFYRQPDEIVSYLKGRIDQPGAAIQKFTEIYGEQPNESWFKEEKKRLLSYLTPLGKSVETASDDLLLDIILEHGKGLPSSADAVIYQRFIHTAGSNFGNIPSKITVPLLQTSLVTRPLGQMISSSLHPYRNSPNETLRLLQELMKAEPSQPVDKPLDQQISELSRWIFLGVRRTLSSGTLGPIKVSAYNLQLGSDEKFLKARIHDLMEDILFQQARINAALALDLATVLSPHLTLGIKQATTGAPR